MLVAMFLMVGCQTTQSAETENKTYVVNPFENKEIPPDQVVTSSKPILCGRADAILNDMYKKFVEVPVFLGESKATHPNSGKEIRTIVTITLNEDTGSFTIFEQMPLEPRLFCILSVGEGKFKRMKKGIL